MDIPPPSFISSLEPTGTSQEPGEGSLALGSDHELYFSLLSLSLQNRVYSLAKTYLDFLKNLKSLDENQLSHSPHLFSKPLPEHIPLPLLFPAIYFKEHKEAKAKKKKRLFKEVYIKNTKDGKLEKAFIYLMKISSKHFCFEMFTHDDILIGTMEVRLFKNFLWVEYIRNFSKDLESSQWKNRAFSFSDIGKHFIYIAYDIYKKGLSFIALNQGFASKSFYEKFHFSNKVPKDFYSHIQRELPSANTKNLYIYY